MKSIEVKDLRLPQPDPDRPHLRLALKITLCATAIAVLAAGCASSGGNLMKSGATPRQTTAVAVAPSAATQAPQERVYGATLVTPVVKDQSSVASTVQAVAPAKDLQGRTLVVVQAGDTLLGIARQHRVSVAELMSVNKLSSITVAPGQRLSIPKR